MTRSGLRTLAETISKLQRELVLLKKNSNPHPDPKEKERLENNVREAKKAYVNAVRNFFYTG